MSERTTPVSRSNLILTGSLALSLLIGAASFGDARASEDKLPAPTKMTADYLAEPAHIKTGEDVWKEQCQHCHGKNAYPGKAPKLQPRRYKSRPDFVWDRVANGFRKMPAWKDVYTEDELIGVVAYILSPRFSP